MFNGQLISNKGVLKYEQTISLQSICAINIVANFWINEKDELEKRIYHFGSESDIEDIILTKIKQLHLPRAITGQLATAIEFVGNSLKSWIEFHDEYLFEYFRYLDNYATEKRTNEQSMKYLHLIKFTNNGMIDQLKTAKNILMKEPNLKLKYKLASHYCLEEEIENIPSEIKEDFFDSFIQEDLLIDEYPMLFYWTYHIKNGNRLLYDLMNNDYRSLNEYIIDSVLENDYHESLYFEVAIKYLWGKLTNTEKSKKVTSVIDSLENPDLQYAFISSLDNKQQQIIFKDISFSFLRNMLHDLMWRDRFVSATCHIIDILDQDIYYELLSELTDEISYHLSENDKFCSVQCFKDILKSLWKQTPYSFKEYLFKQMNGEGMISLICQLRWDMSLDLIQMLLADMPEKYKIKAIYSYVGLNECTDYIMKEKWDLLDFIIKIFLVTDENHIKFKDYLVSKCVMKVCIHHLKQDNLDKINYFLHWAFKSEDEIADFKKSIRLTQSLYKYDIFYLQNTENRYSWNFPSEETVKKFKKFFSNE